jgi:hypothetical protein
MVDAKTDLENIQGYRAVTVTVDGVPEEVRVKKLNVYDLQAYAMCYGDQGKTVELFCGKEERWAAKLSYDDVERILDIGVETNDPILIRFSERDGAILERMIKVLSKQTEKRRALTSLLDGSVSRSESLPVNRLTK